MEGYMWLILISMLAVGILFGFVIGRSKGDVSAPKVRELEKDLHQAKEEMQSYRNEVTQHFEKTANLFNQLTNDYRLVYEHLAKSSHQLCGEQAAQLKSLTADKGVLEGQPAQQQDAKGAAPAQAQPDKDRQQAKPEAKPEAKKQPAEARQETPKADAAKKGDGETQPAEVAAAKTEAPSEAPPRTVH